MVFVGAVCSRRDVGDGRGGAEIRLSRPDRPDNATEFVGHRDRGFIVPPSVLHGDGPLLEARARRSIVGGTMRRDEHRPRPVG